MAERSLRGMSIGAKSLESDDNVDFAARTDVAYVCPKGHRTILPFAEGAEFPDVYKRQSQMSGSAAAAPSRTVKETMTTRLMKSPSRHARTGTCSWNVVPKTN